MFEQRRCQRGATRKGNVRAILRLDAANARDDVRSKALGRPSCKTFRTVGNDIFCCRIEAVRHRTARCLWPEARPDIIGTTAKQQIEALAIRGEDCISASGVPIGRGPVAVGEIAVIGGVLDHAVQRDMFHDPNLSHEREFPFCPSRPRDYTLHWLACNANPAPEGLAGRSTAHRAPSRPS
jgi:hypothetical protein